jgi:TolB-like protein
MLVAAATAAFAEPLAVSVLYFENTTKNAPYAWFSKGAADMLITDLAAQPGLTVVEREQMQKVLKEQEKAMSDLYDEKNAVRIGKLTAARQIVIGSFIIYEKTMRVDAKVVEVETGKVLTTMRAEGALDKLFAVQRDLTAGVLKRYGLTAGAPAASDTQSLEAAQAYYTGIDFLDQGAFKDAAKSFQQAIEFDPYYAKPQKSLEDAYRFLKDFKKQRFQRELARLYMDAAALKKRIDAPVFLSYGDFVTDCYKKGLSAAEIKKLTDANPSIMKGNTRAECTWELQNTLREIGDQAEENFGDKTMADRMNREVMHITDQGRSTFKDDPFLPEILYQEVLALSYFQDWQKMMTACEYLMERYSDYRMMWAIEDFYARAIEKLGGKKADDDE